MIPMMLTMEIIMLGLFSFSDAKSNDGGLQLIPGFQHHLKEWASNNAQFSSEGLVMVPTDDPMLEVQSTYSLFFS